MIIYFLRHANAGKRLANPKRDEKRPLDKEGMQQCGLVGRALAAMEIQIDAIVTSPLKRASQTAALVANELGYDGKLQIDSALKPSSSFAEFRQSLQKYLKLEAIIVVGHNPNLSEFLGEIISQTGKPASIDLKKGAIARVEVNRHSATLNWCLTPRVLKSLHATAADKSVAKTSKK